jgi:phosphate transport system substrate-binding protein
MLKTFVAAIGGLAIATTAAAADISGAGATFPAPVYAKWAEAYKASTGVGLNYQAIGSGGGIKQIKAKTVDFGASDKPLKPDELSAAGLYQFPTVVGGVVPVMNLPGIAPGQIKLNGSVLGDIYLGKITKWNDPALQKLNPSLHLPDMAISVVHRSDGSGTTFTLADYLSKVSPEWKQKVGENTAINWPVGIGGKGNQGLAGYVQRLQGSIGYVEYAYILENHMNYARMVNSAGNVVSPSLEGFQAAAANVDFTKVQDFYVILTDQPGARSWPISGCTWEILRKSAPKTVNGPVTTFFLWGFEHGQDMAKSIAFGPLPDSAVLAIQKYWKQNLGI